MKFQRSLCWEVEMGQGWRGDAGREGHVCVHTHMHARTYVVHADVTRDVTFSCTMYLE